MNIGIVNDLPLAVEAMRRAIARRPEHRVLWVATDGAQAVELCAAQPPDVVLMDLIMPKFDGIEATRRIMRSERPCAILIVTSCIGANAWRVFEAMGARLLDAPGGTRLAGTASRAGGGPLIAIGASAGGPGALASILGGLPADFSAPIVIVQHVDRAFAEGMAQWLDGQTPLTVRVAHEGDRPQPGVALLAATDDHLRITRAGTLEYTREPAATPYRPSVDVFFNSLTEHWPGRVIGVLLTGMGRDGAIGLKALRMKGYHTIAQDEATSAVYGMPKAAATLGAARAILPLGRIAGELAALARI
ncbi:chemotaxis response regulator protein-glutamate methylesterase [Burkholderia contaminans]|uniref:chemotaxis response regulator protein-glutamate methylesterase n=1 Tax=Burkholderia contaminans TaxID=488447 RepID=UPI00084BEE53|nr:chemotaxis response regulator protein-glutamate methylesterase [Burkholderia contaminans]ODN27472.1 chemotaxis response regulator protein-glutamate methylesterase [Burkholderia contaminans]